MKNKVGTTIESSGNAKKTQNQYTIQALGFRSRASVLGLGFRLRI